MPIPAYTPDDNTGEPSPAYLAEIEALAVRLAREAGAMLLQHFATAHDVQYKGNNPRDPVSEADKRVEAYLREQLRKEAPDHGIVAEEGENQGHAQADFAWVIDPLDGTSNFINRLPIWVCSIGVLYKGRPVVGAIFAPSIETARGVVFHARRGGGAFREDMPISVIDSPEPSPRSLTSLPPNYWRQYRILKPLQGKTGILRSTGSIAYEMASVAGGIFQYSLFNQSSVWDVGAGTVIVQEAGGKVLVRNGRTWRPFDTFGPGGRDRPTLEHFKTWRLPLLAGHPRLVDFVAANLEARPRYWFRFRRYVRERWQRATGKKT